jgi:hypothetical protein
MSESRAYKYIEVTATSGESTDAAIRTAVETAAKSVRHIRWFEVLEQRGHVEDGHVTEWQVTVKLAFRVEQ